MFCVLLHLVRMVAHSPDGMHTSIIGIPWVLINDGVKEFSRYVCLNQTESTGDLWMEFEEYHTLNGICKVIPFSIIVTDEYKAYLH